MGRQHHAAEGLCDWDAAGFAGISGFGRDLLCDL